MSKQKPDRSEDLYAGTLFATTQPNTSSLEEVESSIKNNPEIKKLLAVIYPENKEEVENSIRITINLANISGTDPNSKRFLDELISSLQGYIQLQIESQLKFIRSILEEILKSNPNSNLRISDPTVLLTSLQMAQELFMMKEGGVVIKPTRELFVERYKKISIQEALASGAKGLSSFTLTIRDEVPKNFKIVSKTLGINLVEKENPTYQRAYKDEDDNESKIWLLNIRVFKSPANNRFLVECFKFFDIELPEM